MKIENLNCKENSIPIKFLKVSNILFSKYHFERTSFLLL